MYDVDKNLIARAKSKATGATTHNVENAIGYYKRCSNFCKTLKEKGDLRLSHWEECLDVVERRLRILIFTGELVSYEEVRKRIREEKE